MDVLRPVLLAALRLVERGLDAIADARTRVAMRRFLKQHPEVTVHPWTDGTN